jgi:hypothetical protein
MANWKKQSDSRGFTAEYLKFEDGETKELTVSEWKFGSFPSGYLFRCYVTKENGEEVDKIWTIWDYQSVQRLKKVLGTKSTFGTKEIKVKMTVSEDDESTFEFV